ncbi:riboflavin synthase [Clostridium intestinale]|uniref:Riboflavin synthase n=1 Tax=Clostridium intestinale DSM 6191 TaxID=1121320 RepID=A0A1M5Z9N8_9CLOT|nr:riboflavin synthase [Clostridium intestinale]SHI20941.1 riboflavin synthase alpha chain [Clostridium intestinale DSM 6191]
MFTGIVEEIGTVVDFEASQNVLRIRVQASKVLEETYLGDSISTNGVCLTVTDIGKNYFYADVMGETVRRSNLGTLKKGDKVNLERAMTANSRFGGHIVSGHIDGKGKITSYEKEGNAVWITIDTDREILKYVVEKGSIAIDGISLTVAYVDDRKFKVSIIPHTSEGTTLLKKKIGEEVNLECDVIGKYVEKLLGFNKKNDEKKSITMDFLINNGF